VTKTEKLDLIGKFESAYSFVDVLVKGLSDRDLRFIPPVEGAWSINDFLVHFLDADVSLAFRVRMAVAQPGFAIPVWDEEAWQERLRYGEEDGPACLREAAALRRRLAAFLRRFADEEWSGYYVEHPKRGRMGLSALLEVYRDHIAFHVPLIKRNLDALKAGGG
jgi:hypothetical protein